MDRSHCGEMAGMAIRGDAIVQATNIDHGGAGAESDVAPPTCVAAPEHGAREPRPLGGATLQLLRTNFVENPGAFSATGLMTTNAAGR